MASLQHNLMLTRAINQVARDEGLLDTARDCFRFVTTFFEPIDASATHIYHSALELSPLSSIVRRLYYHRRHTPFPRVVAGTLGLRYQNILNRRTGRSGCRVFTWSPCGQLVAVSYGEVVDIRDPLTSGLLFTLPPTRPIRALAFSPDGRTLASLSDTSLMVWDIQTGGAAKEVECRGTDFGTPPLVWSLDGWAISTILPVSNTVQVYDGDLGTMQTLGTLQSSDKPHLWAHNKAFRAMTTGWDGQTLVIDIYEVGSVLTKIESFCVGSFGRRALVQSFSPTTYRFSVTVRDQLRILDIRNSECLLEANSFRSRSLSFDGTHSFSSDGGIFAGSTLSSFRIWKYGSGRYTLWTTFSDFDYPHSFRFSPASTSIMGLSVGVLHVWRLDHPPTGHHDSPLTALSDHGTYVATCHRDHTTVTITNLLSQAPPQFIDTDTEVLGLVLTGDVLLVMSHEMETITAWRLTEEGAVDGPPAGDGAAGHGSSIWTISVHSNPTVSIAGQTAVIKWGENVTHIYHTGTGEVLGPAQAPPDSSHDRYSLSDLMHGRHGLRWLEKHDTSSKGGRPVLVTTPDWRWVRDGEGRHRLWILPAWRLHPRNASWLHNSTTLQLESQHRTAVVKF